MTIDDLVAAAVVKYGFRAKYANEHPAAYRDALIRHVHDHDWAAAHELRVGKAQTDWSPEDGKAFVDRFRSSKAKGPKRDFAPGTHTIDAVVMDGHFETTDAELMRMAGFGLHALCERRQARPSEELPIFVSVLTLQGKMATASPRSDDRLAVLRAMLASEPCFGFFLVFDCFVHEANLVTYKTKKKDAISAHIGSRTISMLKMRPYVVAGNRVTFLPVPPDTDKRSMVGAFDPWDLMGPKPQ